MTFTFTDAELEDPKIRARLQALLDATAPGAQDARPAPAPVRARPRTPQRVVPPTAEEEARASDLDGAKMLRMAERKGMVKP